MQISNIHASTFKGYDARPIKALYMQKSSLVPQDAIYRELYKIGQDVGFDVYMNYSNHELAKNPAELRGNRDLRYKIAWAQDDKLFVNKNGKEKIVYPEESNDIYNTEAPNLAKKLQLESEKSHTWFEGGNVFLGTKDNGENYILIGEDSIINGKKRTLINEGTFKNSLRNYLNGKQTQENDKQNIEEIEFKINNLSQQFNVKKENVFIIKQPAFHLDMALRPLKWPYVLVNDFDETEKVVDNSDLPDEIVDELNRYEFYSDMRGYAKSEETIKELEKFGFKPIKIAGVYGNNVNFMNAIVHEKPDGSLCYITNSCECDKDGYYKLQNTFKKQLKEKCPKINDVRFVSGGPYTVGNNGIMSILKNQSGGVHCLAAERPKI